MPDMDFSGSSNRMSRCLKPHSRDAVFDWFSGKPTPGGGRFNPLFFPSASFDTGFASGANLLLAYKPLLHNML
jgi:hypothetical protein